MTRGALMLLVWLAALLASDRAGACATCSSGDPTLTTAGTEQPFAGRLRAAIEGRYRTDRVGQAGVDQMDIRELSTLISIAWAPRAELLLMADVPLLYRRVGDPSLARVDTASVGDVALRAKWFMLRDRAFSPRVLLALLGGLELPTAVWHDGIPLEAQAGTGSLDVSLGPSLALFAGDVSGYASALWFEPIQSRRALTPGRSLRASGALQYQLSQAFAVRGLSELRWDQQSREAGQPDPNSGGAMLAAGGELLLSPLADRTIVLGARVPVLERWHGAHDEGPLYSLALVGDF